MELSNLSSAAYEQADRINAVVRALIRAAASGSDEESVFEALGCLLDPLVTMTSDLCSELLPLRHSHEPAVEVRP